MKTHLDRFSEIDAKIILPTGSNGPIQLKLSPLAGAENYSHEQLAVFVKNAAGDYGSTAVQGKYTIEGDYLTFSPYFPFEKGVTYVVRAKHPAPESEYAFHSFRLGAKPIVDQPKVLHIYPSADQLPENLLRFYIYFNTPMKKGQALKHIKLIDAAGNVDDQAFMEFKQELWSPNGKRLTILFDPGRIKRGVSTNMELGPALLEGNRYHLAVSTAWKDVYGQPLSEKIKKEFVVIQAYRDRLKANEWKISKPKAKSSEPLSIGFDRVIDHALVESMIHVKEGLNFVAGHWVCLDQERLIQFIPDNFWQKGSYQIVVDSRLEDVAGNNLQSLLDEIELSEEGNADTHQIIDFKI